MVKKKSNSGEADPGSRAGGSRKKLRLHGQIARDIGLAILSGKYFPGHVLDGEVEASTQRHVSRSAYREAVRILSAKGLVESRPRVGTRVSPVEQWHLLDPDVLAWAFADSPRTDVLHGLYELRTIVEPAAAALAAVRRTQYHLDSMRQSLEAMAARTLNEESGRQADMDFHAALLAATGNPFIVSLTKGVTGAVNALTEYKHRVSKLTRDPVPDHFRVYDAIAAKNPEAARAGMRELIRLAILDLPADQRPKPRSQTEPGSGYFLPEGRF